MTDLFGKKKIIVDTIGQVSLDRKVSKNTAEHLTTINHDSKVEFKNGVYLRNGHTQGSSIQVDADWLRLALGKGWEYHKKTNEAPHKTFDNDWAPINVFYGQPLEVKAPIVGEDCYFEDSMGDVVESTLSNIRTRQKIIITCDVDSKNVTEGFGADSTFKEWAALIKSGARSDTGDPLWPLVKGANTGDNRSDGWYYDHYHTAPLPYTKKELLTKQPIGKAFFVDHKTYYNEMAAADRSARYENYITNKTRLHNSLPNIYAFVKLMENKNASPNFVYDLKNTRSYIQNYLIDGFEKEMPHISATTTIHQPPGTVYNSLLRLYPFETLVTLYGIIGEAEGEHRSSGNIGVLNPEGLPMLQPTPGYDYPTKILENIIGMKPEKSNMTALIRSYLKEWMNTMQYSQTSRLLGPDDIGYDEQFTTRIGALENIGYNLIFGPDITPMLNKANKIKKHFPMYNQIEFTAGTTTNLGDTMKKMFLTRFLATQVAASQPFFSYAKWGDRHPIGEGVYKNLRYYQSYRGTGNVFCNSIDDCTDPAADPLVFKTWEELGLDPVYDATTGALMETNIVATGTKNAINTEGKSELNKSNTRMIPKHLSMAEEMTSYEERKQYAKEVKLNADGLPIPGLPGNLLTSQKVATEVPKSKSINAIQITTALEEWMKNKDFSYLNLQWRWDWADPFAARDARNYITYITKDDEEMINLSSDDNAMWKTLLGSTFYAKLVDLYRNNKRTYADILDGTPAYSEDLFYRIEKHVIHYNADTTGAQATDAAGWKIVQNVLIPNTSDLNIVEHVDTQVKYGKDVAYKYKIYACRVVFGCRYKYNWPKSSGNPESYHYEDAIWAQRSTHYRKQTHLYDNIAAPSEEEEYYRGLGVSLPEGDEPVRFSAAPIVTIEPSIKMFEDEVYATPELRILDKPPVPPDVNIVPYRAVNNKIKIMLSGASDRYRAKPIPILDSDVEMFNLIASEGVQNSLDGKIEFGSDDPVNNFQVFRTDKKPTSYLDFDFHPSTPFIFGGSGTLEETILPNTKYYYTFRAVDSNGHISNPTVVYEVQLIDEKGAVKPIIRVISLDKKEENLTIKELQKYVYIKPSAKQMFFSDRDDVDSMFSTEVSEDKTKTKKKKYRMRVTSKSTGKKIDINFSYDKKIIVD